MSLLRGVLWALVFTLTFVSTCCALAALVLYVVGWI